MLVSGYILSIMWLISAAAGWYAYMPSILSSTSAYN